MRSREFKYDFVRFVAMTWVIGVHALTVVDTGRRLGVWYLVLSQAVLFAANPIFFMLSGKFNLRRRNAESWGSFYLRKAKGIVVPVLIVYFIRTGYDMWPDLGTPLHFLKAFALNSVGLFSSREYWFVFQLLSMLLVTPLLVPVVDALSQRKKKVLLGMALGWYLLSFATTNFGITLSYSFLFGGFWISFLMGPFIEELFADQRLRRVLECSVVVGPWATLACVLHGYSSGAFDVSPFFLLTNLGLYLVLLRVDERLTFEPARRAISFCAKHSFAVYLIHMMVLMPLSSRLPTMYGFASILEHWLLTVLTLALCLILAWLLDLLLIRPAQRLFDILVRKIGA